jgi:hypothetical protein
MLECVLISDQATNPEKQELFDARYRSPVCRPVACRLSRRDDDGAVVAADFISEGIPH